ncbi:MAG: hypothetical protein J6S67_12755 [Methanobrevibacter sp.]|nr:hypothetical protein [Methanobrevibacter sp.]
MTMIQTIDISLIPSENKPVINVSQFDNISRVLRFNVFDDFEMEVPHVFDNTETVLLNIRKNDNNIVVITGVIVSDIDPETQEVTGQYITFELTEQACACVGSNYGEVSITSGSDEVIGSCNFKLIVERSPLAGGVSSQTAIDNLTTQIEQITEEVIGENYYTKTETDDLLDDKADITDLPDMSDYYTKTETDNLLDDKADVTDLPDMSDYYTKTETDNLLDDKADVTDLPDMSDYYTKTETDNLLDDKADITDLPDMSDYYTKTETDNMLDYLLPVGSASGEIANFNTALACPLEIESEFGVDAGGIGAINLVKCGGNFFDVSTYTSITPFIDISGLRLGSTYTICAKNTTNIRLYKIAVGAGSSAIWTGSTPAGSSFTVTQAMLDIGRLYIINMSYAGASVSEVQDAKISLNYGNDSTYHEYTTPITTLINLGDTYYNGGKVTIDKNGHRTLTVDDQTVALTDGEPINALVGDNNVYCDTGNTTVQYKDTIQHYIDSRIQAVSNRSLSMQRTLETLEKSVTLDKTLDIERGDNNDDNAR